MVVPKAKLPLFFSTTSHHDNEDDSEVDELQSKSPSAQPGTPPSSPPPNRPIRSRKTRRVDRDVGGDGETPTGTPAASRLRRAQQPEVKAEDPPSDSSQDVTSRRRGEQSNRSLGSSTSKKKAKTPPPTTIYSLIPLPQRAAAQKALPKITYTAKAEAGSKRRNMDWSQYDYIRVPTQISASIQRKPKPDRRKKIKTPSSRLSPLVFDERLRTLYESRQEAVDVGERVCRDSGGEPLFFMNEAKGIGVMSCCKCRRNVDDAVFSLEVRHYEEYDGKGQLTAPLWRPVLINVNHSHPRGDDGQAAKQQKRKLRSSDTESDSDSNTSSLSSCPSAIEGVDVGLEDGQPGRAEQGSVESSTTPSSSYFAFADDPPRDSRPADRETLSCNVGVHHQARAARAFDTAPVHALDTGSAAATPVQPTAASLQVQRAHSSEDSEARDSNARSASIPGPPCSDTSQAPSGPVPSPETQAAAAGLLLFHQAPNTGPTPQACAPNVPPLHQAPNTDPTPQAFAPNVAPILPLALGGSMVAATMSATPRRIGVDPRKRPSTVCWMDSIRKSRQWVSSMAALPLSTAVFPPPPSPVPPPPSPPHPTSSTAVAPIPDTAASHGRLFLRAMENSEARIVVTPPQEDPAPVLDPAQAAIETFQTSFPAPESSAARSGSALGINRHIDGDGGAVSSTWAPSAPSNPRDNSRARQEGSVVPTISESNMIRGPQEAEAMRTVMEMMAPSETASTSEPAVGDKEKGEEDIERTEGCMPWRRT